MSCCDVILDDKHAELTPFAFFFISISSNRAQASSPTTFLPGARGEYFWLQALHIIYLLSHLTQCFCMGWLARRLTTRP